MSNCVHRLPHRSSACDDRRLTVRAAQEITGVAAADFSRNRNANLGRSRSIALLRPFPGLGRKSNVGLCPSTATGDGEGNSA